MSSELPPPLPNQDPNKPPGPTPSGPPLPLMIVAGVFLFGISVAIPFLVRDSIARFAPMSLALIGAFVTVFFKGYRGIFFGFFIALGVTILAAVAVCFGLLSGPQSFK